MERKTLYSCFPDREEGEGEAPKAESNNATEPRPAGSIQIVNKPVEKADKFLFCTWEGAR